jgi:hypothetical protein
MQARAEVHHNHFRYADFPVVDSPRKYGRPRIEKLTVDFLQTNAIGLSDRDSLRR